jgi:hypothetical protein
MPEPVCDFGHQSEAAEKYVTADAEKGIDFFRSSSGGHFRYSSVSACRQSDNRQLGQFDRLPSVNSLNSEHFIRGPISGTIATDLHFSLP